ncbi:MAG: hypothetical protein IJA00_08775 [Bacteroidaceae bacterium]|nr:hypothetical protein [Bacteroidaceae bacterium]
MDEFIYFLHTNLEIIILISIILIISISVIFRKKGGKDGCLKIGCMGILIIGTVEVAILYLMPSFPEYIPSKVDKYIKTNDFNKAHIWIERMRFDYLPSGLTSKEDERQTQFLIRKYDLLNAETTYLFNLMDEESLNRIVSLMYNTTLENSPSIGEFKSYNTDDYAYKTNAKCVDEIMRYNRICDVLLNKAINLNNFKFAKAIIPLYKENLIIKETDFSLFGDNTYVVKLSKEDIDNAKEKLKAAIRGDIVGEGINEPNKERHEYDNLFDTGYEDFIICSQEEIYSSHVTKELKMDLDKDGELEIAIIGLDQTGIKINGYKGGYGMCLLTSLIQNANLLEAYDADSEFNEGYFAQASHIDLDNDGIDEVVIALGNKLTEMAIAIYKTSSVITFPFEFVGIIQGQRKIYVDKEKHIIAPFGSQGLYTEYIYNGDKIKKIGGV